MIAPNKTIAEQKDNLVWEPVVQQLTIPAARYTT